MAAGASVFRPDIQFLRGVSVLLVVIYHADFGVVPAGFLGVDIFFVISGFLISGMVMSDNFSLGDFWFRRARRILPAAMAVLAATLLAAPFFLTEDVRAEAAEQAWGALLFVSNFVLWGQSGYFDAAAETKPFLHFWSLSIEEQFYAFLPVMIMVLPSRFWRPALLILAISSLAACFWLVSRDVSAAFYLPVTRWWELLIGSLLASVTLPRPSTGAVRIARLVALAVIAALALFPTGGLPHPGLAALVICLATAVLLGFPPPSDRANPIYQAVVRLGDISYALYLVHWPVFVFIRAAYDGNAGPLPMGVATILSLLLAVLLHVSIEQPFRRIPKQKAWKLATGLAIAAASIAVLPVVLPKLGPAKPDFEVIRRHNYGVARECAYGEKYAYSGPNVACQTRPDPQILLIGDSYAMAWSSALIEPLADVGIEQATMSACDPLYGLARYSADEGDRYNWDYALQCMTFVERVIDELADRPSIKAVVIAGRLQTILGKGSTLLKRDGDTLVDLPSDPEVVSQALANLARVVKSRGRTFAVIAPPPADGSDIGTCLEQQASGLIRFSKKPGCDMDRAKVDEYRKGTRDMLARAAELGSFKIIEMADALCDANRCVSTLDGTFLYRDAGHLTVEGAKAIGRLTPIGDRLREALSLSKAPD